MQKKSAPAKTPEVIFGKRFNKYYLAGIWGWFGWLQFTGFSPHDGDETKEVPITQSRIATLPGAVPTQVRPLATRHKSSQNHRGEFA